MSDESLPTPAPLVLGVLLKQTLREFLRNILTILKLGWLVIFFNIILTVALTPFIAALRMAAQGTGQPPVPLAFPELTVVELVVLLLAMIGMLFSAQSLTISVARLTALGEREGEEPFQRALNFGRRQGLALALQLATGCLLMPLSLFASQGGVPTLAIAALTAVAFIVIGPAIILSFPAIALDVPNPLKKAWLLSNGQRGRIITAWLITTLCLYGGFALVQSVLTLFQVGTDVLLANFADPADTFRFANSPAVTIVLGAVSGIMLVILQAVPAILGTFIWLRLSRVSEEL